MLIDRLVFGTARLNGGAEARSSRRLLEAALAAGFRHIDTAPVYGSGTAETVVGEVLAGDQDVLVTTKVGLEPPPHATLRTWAHAVHRRLHHETPTLDQDHPPAQLIDRNPRGAFDPEQMRRSIHRSLRRLRRDRIDLLLIHDAYRADLNAVTISFLDREQAQGRAAGIGYATAASHAPVLDGLVPSHWTAQVGFDPRGIFGGAGPLRPRMIVHSLAKVWFHCIRLDPRLPAATSRLLATLATRAPVDSRSLEIAALYALAAAWLPDARLVYATTDRDRLDRFVTALCHIDRSTKPGSLAAAFQAAYRSSG